MEQREDSIIEDLLSDQEGLAPAIKDYIAAKEKASKPKTKL